MLLTFTIIVSEMECQPTATGEQLSIVVNGAERPVFAGQTIAGLLAELGLDPARVAIELDRRIVKRPEWDSLALAAGARLEIVQFVGGG
jgi:thiamine biosynthesis protein ThiS